MHNKAFTAMLPPAKYVEAVDYFGIVSGRDTDKLKDTGLTHVKGDYVNAPYIKEFPFIIECEMTNYLDIKAHTLFVGEVKDIKVEEDLICEKGKIDFKKANILTFDWSTNEYLGTGDVVAKAFSSGLKFKKK